MPGEITFRFDDEQMAALRRHVEEVTVELRDQLNAAEDLAGGVRSFLGSLPYMAPEMLGEQARVKLAGPLAAYEALRDGDDEPGATR